MLCLLVESMAQLDTHVIPLHHVTLDGMDAAKYVLLRAAVGGHTGGMVLDNELQRGIWLHQSLFQKRALHIQSVLLP